MNAKLYFAKSERAIKWDDTNKILIETPNQFTTFIEKYFNVSVTGIDIDFKEKTYVVGQFRVAQDSTIIKRKYVAIFKDNRYYVYKIINKVLSSNMYDVYVYNDIFHNHFFQLNFNPYTPVLVHRKPKGYPTLDLIKNENFLIKDPMLTGDEYELIENKTISSLTQPVNASSFFVDRSARWSFTAPNSSISDFYMYAIISPPSTTEVDNYPAYFIAPVQSDGTQPTFDNSYKKLFSSPFVQSILITSTPMYLQEKRNISGSLTNLLVLQNDPRIRVDVYNSNKYSLNNDVEYQIPEFTTKPINKKTSSSTLTPRNWKTDWYNFTWHNTQINIIKNDSKVPFNPMYYFFGNLKNFLKTTVINVSSKTEIYKLPNIYKIDKARSDPDFYYNKNVYPITTQSLVFTTNNLWLNYQSTQYNSFKTSLANNEYSRNMGIASGITGALSGVATGMALGTMGNPMAGSVVGSSIVGGITSVANTQVNYSNTYDSLIANTYDLQNAPQTPKSLTVDGIISQMTSGISFSDYDIFQLEQLPLPTLYRNNMINYMFGCIHSNFEQNISFKIFKIFNYWKISDLQSAMWNTLNSNTIFLDNVIFKTISDTFEKGVRLWSLDSGVEIGDYSYENW